MIISTSLKALLESADIRVVMTRETDIELASPDSPHKKADDLKARVRIAEECENAVFVSIHMNKFPKEQYSGLQVYYSSNNTKSKEIAQSVQNMAKLTLQPENNREVKSAGDSIYILKNTDIPAILVECGFISNQTECIRLCNEEYQNRLCEAIVEGIIKFLK